MDINNFPDNNQVTLAGYGSSLEHFTIGIQRISIRGTDAAETIIASGGVDFLDAGGGDDVVICERLSYSGRPTISGGAGNDRITYNDSEFDSTREFERSTILGGEGNDTITSFSTFDYLDGGDGDDLLLVETDDDSPRRPSPLPLSRSTRRGSKTVEINVKLGGNVRCSECLHMLPASAERLGRPGVGPGLV